MPEVSTPSSHRGPLPPDDGMARERNGFRVLEKDTADWEIPVHLEGTQKEATTASPVQ